MTDENIILLDSHEAAPGEEPKCEEFPRDVLEAIQRWRMAALEWQDLRTDAETAKAAGLLMPDLPEGVKATEATRDAYAQLRAAELIRAARRAEVEAKARWYWCSHLMNAIPEA